MGWENVCPIPGEFSLSPPPRSEFLISCSLELRSDYSFYHCAYTRHFEGEIRLLPRKGLEEKLKLAYDWL